MSIEKKLEYFTEIINREAEIRKRQAREQLDRDFVAAVSLAQAQAQEETDAQVQVQAQAIANANNKRITEAEIEARRAIATLRERLTAQLFDNIRADMVSFTKAPEYENFIAEKVKLAQANQYYAYIQLTPDDVSLGDAIQKETGLTPEKGDPSMLGGFRLLTANRNKSADHSIQAKLSAARQAFSIELDQVVDTSLRT